MAALTIIPTAAAYDAALSPAALRVLAAMPSVELASVNVSQLARELHMHRSTAYKAIRLLAQLHYLIRVPDEAGRTLYRVNLLRGDRDRGERSA